MAEKNLQCNIAQVINLLIIGLEKFFSSCFVGLLAFDQVIGDEEGGVLGSLLLQFLWHLDPRTLGGLQLEELITVEAYGQSGVGNGLATASDKNDAVPKIENKML